MTVNPLGRFSDYRRVNRCDVYYLVYGPLIRALEQAISEHAKGRVLDIGCGNKPYEAAFRGKITEYVGCDVVQSDRKRVDILCSANCIPLPDQQFDTVFSTQTIEHVADYQGLVNEAWRLLRPGGVFILSGPMYWPLHEEPHDYFRFTRHGFAHILGRVGFEVLDIVPNGGMWATTEQSLIHSLLNVRRDSLLLRMVRSLFFRLQFHWLANFLFGWLDSVDFNPITTMNYVVVARRR